MRAGRVEHTFAACPRLAARSSLTRSWVVAFWILLTIAGVAEVGQASHALKDDFSVPHNEPHGALAGPETAQRRPAPNRKKLPF